MTPSRRTIVWTIGIIVTITGLTTLPALFCAFYFHETNVIHGLQVTLGIALALGVLLLSLGRHHNGKLCFRDGYLLVSISWIICSILGALPYWLSGEVPTFIDGLFESAAGYTTTGATVLSEWSFGHSIIMWRATTNWLGGFVILIFIISLLPLFGSGGHRVASAEAPWSSYTKTAPKISDIAKILLSVYLLLTVLEFILLALGPMDVFESMVNSMGSVSTAGLLLHPGGMAYYDSFYVELVISIFTILASVNFILYIYLTQRNYKGITGNVELKIFLGLIVIATALVTADLAGTDSYDSLWSAFRHAFFQVTSFATTSGYTIGDPGNWPAFTKSIFMVLLFVGGCAASTSGGIKILRITIIFKLIARGFVKRLHPQAICAVKMGPRSISAPMASAVVSFAALYCGIFLFTALVLSLQNLDMETTLSASAALLSNTGIGFGEISSGDFSVFTLAPLKAFMCLVMVIGRLELFSIIFLFVPSFWDRDRSRPS